MGRGGPDALRMLWCGGCGERFFVCGPCYRGQRYCSEACRAPARRAQKRAARLRHQRSPAGRADHRDHQRAYRARLALVMDHSSEAPTPMEILVIAEPDSGQEPAVKERMDELLYVRDGLEPQCRFCGRRSAYIDCG